MTMAAPNFPKHESDEQQKEPLYEHHDRREHSFGRAQRARVA
jgi:hypothetical protein